MPGGEAGDQRRWKRGELMLAWLLIGGELVWLFGEWRRDWRKSVARWWVAGGCISPSRAEWCGRGDARRG